MTRFLVQSHASMRKRACPDRALSLPNWNVDFTGLLIYKADIFLLRYL